MKSMRLQIIILLFTLLFANNSFSQLIIDNTSMTPAQLVQNVLVGGGVTVSNVAYSGAIPNSIGKFSTGGNPTNLGMTSGIIMSTGNVMDAPGPNNSGSTGTDNYYGSDPDLAMLIPGYTVYDAAVLSFTFKPLSDTIKFKYVFGSEEYPEWVGSNYNDVFGFFLSGPGISGPYSNNAENIAIIPGTSLPVTINNVNSSSYSQYYVDNTGGATIQYDGFTTVLTAWRIVTPCANYQIKIAIGDAGDSNYDSAVFLDAESFSTNAVSVNYNYTIPGDTMAYRGCSDAILNFQLPQPAITNTQICYHIGGSAVNGVDYNLIDTCVNIAAGLQSAQVVITPIETGVPAGIQTVKIILETNPCQNDTLTIYLRDYPPLSLNIPDDTICNGQSATLSSNLSGGVGPFTYLWSGGEQTTSIQEAPPGPSVNTYYLTVTDACTPHTKSISDSVKLVVHAVPTSLFNILPNDTICLDDTLNLNYSGNATANANYTWSFSGGNVISGAGQGPYKVNWSTPSLYSLSLSVSENGCNSDTTYKSVTVLPSPIINISSNITSGCRPLTVNFNDSTADATHWNWTFNGGNPGSSTNENPTNIVYNNPGTYNVTLNVVNIYGCKNTKTFNNFITAYPTPVADFTYTPTVSMVGLPINFNSSSSSAFVTSWKWNFGDAGTSIEQNPTHPYAQIGYETIWLVVETAHGCIDSTSKEILIIDIKIPNVFTPNSDGINDYFVIHGIEYVPNCQLVIFNRWGNKVYESTSYKNDWDGGKSSDGTYYYIFTLPQGIHDPYHGTVTIIR